MNALELITATVEPTVVQKNAELRRVDYLVAALKREPGLKTWHRAGSQNTARGTGYEVNEWIQVWPAHAESNFPVVNIKVLSSAGPGAWIGRMIVEGHGFRDGLPVVHNTNDYQERHTNKIDNAEILEWVRKSLKPEVTATVEPNQVNLTPVMREFMTGKHAEAMARQGINGDFTEHHGQDRYTGCVRALGADTYAIDIDAEHRATRVTFVVKAGHLAYAQHGVSRIKGLVLTGRTAAEVARAAVRLTNKIVYPETTATVEPIDYLDSVDRIVFPKTGVRTPIGKYKYDFEITHSRNKHVRVFARYPADPKVELWFYSTGHARILVDGRGSMDTMFDLKELRLQASTRNPETLIRACVAHNYPNVKLD